jgi:hypothetical protein
MELKKNNDNVNQGPQGGAPAGDYYSQRDMMNSAYGNTAPGAQGQGGYSAPGQFGGPAPGPQGQFGSNTYNGPQGGTPYSQPNQQSPYSGGGAPYQQAQQQQPRPPYGGGYNGGNGGGAPYPQHGQSAFDGGATTMKSSSINPLVIIIPILVILAIVGVSQYKKIFGQSKYIPGKLEGQTFTNEYFGFTTQNFDGWDMTGYAGGEETELSMLKGNQAVVELTASKKMGTEAFSFGVKKTPYNININDKSAFSKLVESYQEDYKKELSAQGYEVTSIKQEKMTIAGKTCDGYIITGKVTSGGMTVEVDAAQFFMTKGNYISVFSGISTSIGGARNAIAKHIVSY